MKFGFMAGRSNMDEIFSLSAAREILGEERSLDGFCGFRESFWQSSS